MSGPGGGAGLALFALLGTVFGSFATAAAWRLPRGEPIGAERSRCPSCATPLAARDLVPVLSWLLAGGCCRSCGGGIGWRYPLTELATAGLFALAWARADGWWQAAVLAVLVTGLVVVVLVDLSHTLIPDQALLVLLPAGVAWQWLGGWEPLAAATGALAGLGLGLGLRWGFRAATGREALGLGDVKFLAVAGVWLGLGAMPAFLIAAGLLGVAFGAAWRLGGRGEVFPFGPALAAALLLLVLAPPGWAPG